MKLGALRAESFWKSVGGALVLIHRMPPDRMAAWRPEPGRPDTGQQGVLRVPQRMAQIDADGTVASAKACRSSR